MSADKKLKQPKNVQNPENKMLLKELDMILNDYSFRPF